jgi:hypothetical protein
MRVIAPTPLDQHAPRTSRDDPDPGAPRPLRRPVRPLDDGTTELVHLIEFILPAGDSVQPVIFLDRQLLD